MTILKLPAVLCTELCAEYEQYTLDQDVLRKVRFAASSLIEQAVDAGLTPASLPHAQTEVSTHTVSLPRAVNRAIRAFARQEGIREGDAALRYLYAALARGYAQNHSTQAPAEFLSPYLLALGLDHRHPQDTFAKYLLDTLSGNGIGFVEAGTGIGKTLATVAVTNESLRMREGKRCVVAVPTLELLNQYVRQHEALRAAGVSMVGARPVVGRSHFVDIDELSALASSGFIDAEISRKALQWLSDGAPPDPRDIGSSPYLLSGLKAASPDFPVEAVGLRTDSSPEGLGAIAYAAQFQWDAEDDKTDAAEVIYCTHAMLAADLRVRKRLALMTEEGQETSHKASQTFEQIRLEANLQLIDAKQAGQLRRAATNANINELAEIIESAHINKLPPWQYLVIDEAHLFESNLSGALSDSLSILRFLRNVETLSLAGLISKSITLRVIAAIKLIRHKASKAEAIDLTSDSEDAQLILAGLVETYECVTKGLAKTDRKERSDSSLLPATRQALEQLRIQLSILKSATQAERAKEMRATLTYSPVREFPQLQVGRASVASELTLLWSFAESVACVSATLYLRRLDRDSARFIATILNIPRARLQEYPTIKPTWSYAPVLGLWTPQNRTMPDGRMWLRPPTRSDRLGDESAETNQVWLAEVSEVLREIHATSSGGVLVLMTSYASIDTICKLLADRTSFLIQAKLGYPLATQVRDFGTLHNQGEKPLWISLGAAWTGLDVNGKAFGIDDPAMDNLMTDLVIPRIPFGLNRSITHKTRLDVAPSIEWELHDTVMRFKQGMGRLVRREGLPVNRRIFVLDGRLNDSSFKGYLSSIERLMDIYPRKTLTVSDKQGQWLNF